MDFEAGTRIIKCLKRIYFKVYYTFNNVDVENFCNKIQFVKEELSYRQGILNLIYSKCIFKIVLRYDGSSMQNSYGGINRECRERKNKTVCDSIPI